MDAVSRRQRWLLFLSGAAGAGAAGYGLYRLYHHPAVALRRRRIAAAVEALISIAETASLLSSDLSAFIRSDSDQIPQSLRQLAKISQSPEFGASVSNFSEALTRGFIRALNSRSSESDVQSSTSSSSFADRVSEKMLSPAGSGFASAVAGAFAKNLVLAYYSAQSTAGASSSRDSVEPQWLEIACSDKVKAAISEWVQVIVSAATSAYLERTMSVDTCDQIMSCITKPKHEAKVKDLLVSVCNGAVETLVKTSHQVMTTSKSSTSPAAGVELNQIIPPQAGKMTSFNEGQGLGQGWVNQVYSTLAVPSNRGLVLDLTGRVTAETMKSFLGFLSQRLSDGAKKSIRVARDEVVERGVDTIKCLSAKSVAIFTICLAMCMHISVGTRLLMPA